MKYLRAFKCRYCSRHHSSWEFYRRHVYRHQRKYGVMTYSAIKSKSIRHSIRYAAFKIQRCKQAFHTNSLPEEEFNAELLSLGQSVSMQEEYGLELPHLGQNSSPHEQFKAELPSLGQNLSTQEQFRADLPSRGQNLSTEGKFSLRAEEPYLEQNLSTERESSLRAEQPSFEQNLSTERDLNTKLPSSGKKLQCKFCPKVVFEVVMKKHMQNNHTSKHCVWCNEYCSPIFNYKVLQRHLTSIKHRCETCKKIFNVCDLYLHKKKCRSLQKNKTISDGHVNRQNTKAQVDSSPILNQDFEHILTWNECSPQDLPADTMKKDVENSHNAELPRPQQQTLQCEFCHLVVPEGNMMKQHLQDIHASPLCSRCRKYGGSCFQYQDLYNHLASTAHCCESCSQVYLTGRDMYLHKQTCEYLSSQNTQKESKFETHGEDDLTLLREPKSYCHFCSSYVGKIVDHVCKLKTLYHEKQMTYKQLKCLQQNQNATTQCRVDSSDKAKTQPFQLAHNGKCLFCHSFFQNVDAHLRSVHYCHICDKYVHSRTDHFCKQNIHNNLTVSFQKWINKRQVVQMRGDSSDVVPNTSNPQGVNTSSCDEVTVHIVSEREVSGKHGCVCTQKQTDLEWSDLSAPNASREDENRFIFSDASKIIVIVCKFCKKCVPKQDMQKHLSNSHACKLCWLCKLYSDSKLYYMFLSNHLESNDHCCDFCGECFEAIDLHKHRKMRCMQQQGSKNRYLYVCKFCIHTCGTEDDFKYHLNSHFKGYNKSNSNFYRDVREHMKICVPYSEMSSVISTDSHTCRFCGKQYITEVELKSHASAEHECQQYAADKKVSTLSSGDTILSGTKHTGLQTCTICKQNSRMPKVEATSPLDIAVRCAFCNQFVLPKIMKIHLAKSHSCKICSVCQKYRRRVSNYAYTEIIGHIVSNSHMCDICSKCFRADDLHNHKKMCQADDLQRRKKMCPSMTK